MKPCFPIAVLLLLGVSACAHNPRPESPEQRAERQAHSLQQQQNAQSDPRHVSYSAREDVSEDEQQAGEQQNPQPAEQQPATDQLTREQARAQARRHAAAVRSSVRTTLQPVYIGIGGVTGGILR
jgi:hypothetical protein